jgi:hypothetical protein
MAVGGGTQAGGGSIGGGSAAGGGVATDGGTSDGTPTRQMCTSNFGTGLTGTSFGRLDGFLVSLVPDNTMTCNGDASHLHLQILMNTRIYDIAVNLDAAEIETSHALLGGAWAEGWHNSTQTLDYVNDLGLHSPQFTMVTRAATRARLETLLSTTNHISVFSTRYSGSGAHLIHRNRNQTDGALVLSPLSSNPQFVAFRFSNQSF